MRIHGLCTVNGIFFSLFPPPPHLFLPDYCSLGAEIIVARNDINLTIISGSFDRLQPRIEIMFFYNNFFDFFFFLERFFSLSPSPINWVSLKK